MEFTKIMEIRARMCEKYGKKSCYYCPIGIYYNGKDIICDEFIRKYPALAELFLKKWDAENPVKTFMMDFFEKHPNAPKNKDGTPTLCPCRCGYVPLTLHNCEAAGENRLKCWSRLMEVSKC